MTASAPPSWPAYRVTAPMRNWLGIAALCCGIAGILLGQVPLLFLGSGALGILAVVFGIIGIRRALRRQASNRALAVTGVVTGVIALALAIWGVTIMVSGLNTVSGELDHLDHGTSTTVPATETAHTVINQEDLLVHQALFLGNQ
jgi:Domain of unknown function (DUF4190)